LECDVDKLALVVDQHHEDPRQDEQHGNGGKCGPS
jgi:hypothetical protein